MTTKRQKNDMETERNLKLIKKEDGLYFTDGNAEIHGDFTKLLRRINKNNLNGELIVKAAKIKSLDRPLNIFDATAGLGEDSFLLAAAGHNVTLFEQDKIVFSLLSDTLKRAENDERTKDIVKRMTVFNGNSIEKMKSFTQPPDIIYLDPMFPERQKSSLVKKKFQLIHHIEKPCDNEEELLQAAINAKPYKIIIKRPVKGEYLAGIKPGYSLTGKAVRYDCIVL